MRRLALLLLVGLCACGSIGRAGTGAGVGPSASPAPTSSPLSEAELQYLLVDSVGAPVYCDPRMYPLARNEDPAEVARGVAALRSQSPVEFAAIVRHEHLNAANLSPEDNLRIITQAAVLSAVPLTAQGTAHGFAYEVVGPPTAEVTGTIDDRGVIKVASRAAAPRRPCPICLAPWTRIATPGGELPVTAIRPGLQVWTLDAGGRRVPAQVLAVGHTAAPIGHRLVHLVLADGRNLDVSPGHLLMDGRPVGDLRPGDLVDGSLVTSAERRPYDGAATWDLLPAGPSHVYWADGVPLASTLAKP